MDDDGAEWKKQVSKFKGKKVTPFKKYKRPE